jgi:hypothetical protein
MSTGICRRRIIVAVVATLVISSLATQASAEGRCSPASLQGTYAFRVKGTNVSNPSLPVGPFSAVGRNTYDGHGRMRGVIVVSLNGAMISTSYKGTYTLADDCTGSKSAALDIGLTVDFDFVVDSNLRGIQMIVTQAGPANARADGLTISGSARKLFAAKAKKD